MNKEPVKIWRKRTLEGNRECKVPEAEVGLVRSKKAGGQWLEECLISAADGVREKKKKEALGLWENTAACVNTKERKASPG